MSIRYYFTSYHNPRRRAAILERFAKEGIEIEEIPCVEHDDPRLQELGPNIKANSIFYSQFNELQAFYDSGADYGVFCEDDILIKKGIHSYVSLSAAKMKEHGYDIVLLGYLIRSSPVGDAKNLLGFDIRDAIYFLDYPTSLWGAQMYILTRKHAGFLLEEVKDIKKCKEIYTECATDWMITKSGNRKLMYPPVAIEDAINIKATGIEKQFHEACHRFFVNDTFH